MTNGPEMSRGPEYFQKLYAENQDPWNFTASDYERHKYQATLSALGARSFENAFEIGCSVGVLTGMLAARCGSLLAVDIADTALAAARENSAAFQNVRFERLQVPLEWPSGQTFDLIICSEVLYFLSPADVQKAAKLAFDSLVPGGVVLLVNYTEPIDEPCSGDDAAAIFIKASEAAALVERQIRDERYRIDVLVKHGG